MTTTATLATSGTLHGKCTNCGEFAYRTHLEGPVSHSDSGEQTCAPVTQVTVTFAFPTHLIVGGWGGDLDEFGASVAATLHELIGDDGGAYSPANVQVTTA